MRRPKKLSGKKKVQGGREIFFRAFRGWLTSGCLCATCRRDIRRWRRSARAGRALSAAVLQFLDVISGRKNLASFFIRDGNVDDEPLDKRGFPNFLLGREGASDLLLAFEQRVHGCLLNKTPPVT